jgi:hypothetical protein
MNEVKKNFLYQLLPAVYRQIDQQQGLSLETLLNIMETEWENIRAQVDTAYSNCFVETCEPWAEAYIADLLGIKGLHDSTVLSSQRARIANTIRYRRRKGQRGILEHVINDVTGWRALVVEYMQLLSVTQHLKHIRLGKSQTINIRNIHDLATLGTPFDVNSHLIDVHDIPRYPAKFNINNLGLFIWRLVSYPVVGGTAYAVDTSHQKYTFNPVGFDTQLFNTNQVLTDFTETATETNLPVAIRPAAFQEDLAQEKDPQTQNSKYYGPQRSFCIWVDNKLLKPNQIIAADLSQWKMPIFSPQQKAAIDVKLGRIMLKDADQHVTVNYRYGFSAPIGGGRYDRRKTLEKEDMNTVYVPIAPPGLKNPIAKPTLQEAIDYWQKNLNVTTIQIENDATYTGAIEFDNQSNSRALTIQAANNTRPCLQVLDDHGKLMPIVFKSTPNSTLQVTLNGLWINSHFLDLCKNVSLIVSHCTLIPSDPQNAAARVSLFCSTSQGPSEVTISNSITGAIYLPEDVANLKISNSIIDAEQQVALAAFDLQSGLSPTVMSNPATMAGPNTILEQVTILGSVYVSELILLSNSIITQKVKTNRTQTGVIRFSYLPLDSETPPRYQCQPDLDFIPQAQQRAQDEGLSHYTDLKTKDPIWWRNTLLILKPQFTSTKYPLPGYAQLNIRVKQSILEGADNGAEMGCFQPLNQPLLQKQLQEILYEYLPFGLKSVLFYIT